MLEILRYSSHLFKECVHFMLAKVLVLSIKNLISQFFSAYLNDKIIQFMKELPSWQTSCVLGNLK